MKSIKLLLGFLVLFTTSYGNDDVEIKLWEAATTASFCRSITFKGMNADIYNEHGQTPLMIAVQKNNRHFIDCLKEAKVDILLEDNDGKTAFDYIKKPKSRIEENHSTITYNALRSLEVHQIVGDKGRIVQEVIDTAKNSYKLWLEGALCKELPIPKDIQCIERDNIDRSGALYEIYEKDVNRGVPAIFAAIQNNLHNKLIELLSEGANIDMKNKFGTTPLSFSIHQNDDSLAEILLEQGANPYIINSNIDYTPLSEAAVANKISIVKLLLQYGTDVNFQHKKSETALTVASKGCENFELVELLLDHGADPKLIDTYGKNTITGLSRYCTDKDKYEKMIKLIKNRN